MSAHTSDSHHVAAMCDDRSQHRNSDLVLRQPVACLRQQDSVKDQRTVWVDWDLFGCCGSKAELELPEKGSIPETTSVFCVAGFPLGW